MKQAQRTILTGFTVLTEGAAGRGTGLLTSGDKNMYKQ
jgi:hypothetical protein